MAAYALAREQVFPAPVLHADLRHSLIPPASSLRAHILGLGIPLGLPQEKGFAPSPEYFTDTPYICC
jgi:hypothetical protein